MWCVGQASSHIDPHSFLKNRRVDNTNQIKLLKLKSIFNSALRAIFRSYFLLALAKHYLTKIEIAYYLAIAYFPMYTWLKEGRKIKICINKAIDFNYFCIYIEF